MRVAMFIALRLMCAAMRCARDSTNQASAATTAMQPAIAKR